MEGEDEAAQVAELQRLLNEWDPIGDYDSVTDFPSDEYDCLYHPLLGRLRRGEGAGELAEFLHRGLTDHFGLSADVADRAEFAQRLVTWYGERWGSGTHNCRSA